VITTNTAGCREAVLHGVNGLLVPVRDTEALANAMLQFNGLSLEEKRQMGLRGRQLASELFDQTYIADEIYRIISPFLFSEQ
jgi:glycosyltransferase involved in cell wall biosynthesis